MICHRGVIKIPELVPDLVSVEVAACVNRFPLGQHVAGRVCSI